MSITKQLVRVFLSSPGDVGAHRDAVREVVRTLNDDPFIGERCVLQTIGWDTAGAAVPLNANQTPQSSVNEYLPLPRDCDLTIVLLWGRLGTPLPSSIQREGGGQFESGTTWEIEDARSGGSPVWIYHKTTSPQIALDDQDFEEKRSQFAKVKAYLAGSRSKDGSILFGVHEFENDEQLRTLVTEHLRQFVRVQVQVTSGSRADASPAAEVKSASHNRRSECNTDVIEDAVHATLEITRASNSPGESGQLRQELFELSLYPVGPMIRDVIISKLAENIAELKSGENPKIFFALVNTKLAESRKPSDPELRLSTVMFPSGVGGKYFWEAVLLASAVQGPRMLAAVLSLVDPLTLDQPAQTELFKLRERINSYV
jgi:hypothetical protein